MEGSPRKGGLQVTLGSSDSTEEVDDFVGNGVLMEEGNLFGSVENEQIPCMGKKEG